jgi:colanic acid/amylovoran biosynthesis protein
MEILLINLHSSNNLGDAALARISIELLKSAFPSSNIKISMNDPDSHKGADTSLPSFTKLCKKTSKEKGWSIPNMLWTIFTSLVSSQLFRYFRQKVFWGMTNEQKSLISAYIESDIVISVAGNPLYSSGRFGLQFLITFYSMAFAILLGKPFYTLPQSIGPIRRIDEGFLLKWLIRRARIVMVRESQTANVLTNLGINENDFVCVPDLAFIFQGSSPGEARKWLKNQGLILPSSKPLIGITAINLKAYKHLYHYQDQYEKNTIKAVSNFLKATNGTAVFFTQVGNSKSVANDYLVAERIFTRINNLGNTCVLCSYTSSPELIKAAYGEMSIFLGTRMHSNIFAISQGIPTLAISYLYKTNGIMEDLGLGNWVVDISEVKDIALNLLLLKLWEERKNVSETIKQNLPEIKAKASKTGLMIANDYKIIPSR